MRRSSTRASTSCSSWWALRRASSHPDALEHPAGGPAANEPRVQVTSTLSEAFAAALSSPTKRAAIIDGDRYIGSFSAISLLESLRRERPDATTEGGSQVASGV